MNTYNHIQSTPAPVWYVAHNLAAYPVSDVVVTFNGQEHKILPQSVVYTDGNNLEIRFSEARAGYVRLVGAYKFVF